MPLCQIQESFSGQLFPLNCCGTIQRAVVTLLQPLESQLEEKSFWRKHTIEGHWRCLAPSPWCTGTGLRPVPGVPHLQVDLPRGKRELSSLRSHPARAKD